MSEPVRIGIVLPELLRSLAGKSDACTQPTRQAGTMGTGDERGSASEPVGVRPAASEALRTSEDTNSPVRGPIEAGASEALRASERRPVHAVEPAGVQPREPAGRSGRAWSKHLNRMELLGDIVKGVVSWACAHGWKRVGIGHRSLSASFYVHLARRSDNHRICVRISDHRHPRGQVKGVSIEWILPEHHAIGVAWLRRWLIEEANH